MSGILIVPEIYDGVFRKVSFEIASQSVAIAKALQSTTTALVIGPEASTLAPQLCKYGVTKIIAAQHADLVTNSLIPTVHALVSFIQNAQPDTVVFPATITGKTISAMVAAKLQTSVVSDCTSWKIEQGRQIFQRPVYASKAIVTLEPLSVPIVVSLRPNVFSAVETPITPVIENVSIPFPSTTGCTHIVGHQRSQQKKIELTEAACIVSGGRGMKGPENYPLIEKLAELLGGAVGASRAIVDAGWRPHEEQVGQTGKTVSPQLYIACGISGAIQHVAGMRTAKIIVAVNKDPEAPIFQIADYGLVGDVLEVLPKMIQEVQKLAK